MHNIKTEETHLYRMQFKIRDDSDKIRHLRSVGEKSTGLTAWWNYLCRKITSTGIRDGANRAVGIIERA